MGLGVMGLGVVGLGVVRWVGYDLFFRLVCGLFFADFFASENLTLFQLFLNTAFF